MNAAPGITRSARAWIAAVLCAMSMLALPAHAQQTGAWTPPKGHGAFSVDYQHLYIRYHADSHGNKQIPGTIRNRSVFFDVDYGLTDRLAISANAAYKSNRYDERIHGSAHNPGSLDHDHGESFLDDGSYHAGWQDWNVGLRYRWLEKPFLVTPYIAYGHPLRDYTTFAHATVGSGQARLEIGVNAGARFPGRAQNLYWQAGYGYAVMQKRDNRRVNHSTFSAELGYLFTPKLAVRGTVSARKTYNGLDFPDDYGNRHDETFFHHDQNVRDDFVNVGVGASYQFNDRYSGYATVGHTVWGENTHLVDYALTVGVSRSF